MRQQQWDLFKKAAKLQPIDSVPVALIIDSPWLPGYLRINHLDYYFDPEKWFDANLRVMQEFPELIVFPSWWVEYGMAIEPSAFGAKICFHQDQPPSQFPLLFHLEDVDRLTPIDPFTDGLMPLALHQYERRKMRIRQAGYDIHMAAARGPLCTAGFIRGITELMLDIVDKPASVHKLLTLITDGIIKWLKAQVEAVGDSIEGILVLDDVVGFLSRQAYLEFAHPYLKQIFDAFPKDWVKVYHNDANLRPFLEDLATTGLDVLNWSHSLDVAEAQRRTGGKICLMGNVAPLEIAARGTAQEVKMAAFGVLDKAVGKGVILSLGGGVSPGMPRANIVALIEAVREFRPSSLEREYPR